MYTYIAVLIFSLFFGIIIHFSNFNKKNQIYLFFMFVFLLLFSAFRKYNIGTDTLSYIKLFIDINTSFRNLHIFGFNIEPLFILLNKITYFINKSPQSILFSTSFIINLLVIMRIFKSSKYPWLSIYLYISMYIYYQSFNGIRQYIAISIIFYISKYIEENKPIKFLLGIILAMGFHTTAIIFLPCYIFNKINISIKKIILFLIATFLLLYNIDELLKLFTDLVPKYKVYYDSFFLETGGIRDLVVSTFIILFGISIDFFNKSNKQINTLTIYMLVYFAFSVMALRGSVNLISRLGWYFSIFVILYVPEVIDTIKNDKIRLVSIYSVISICFFYHLYLLLNNFHRIVPYELF